MAKGSDASHATIDAERRLGIDETMSKSSISNRARIASNGTAPCPIETSVPPHAAIGFGDHRPRSSRISSRS